MKCPICNGKMAHKKQPYGLYGEKLGEFAADVCLKCNEAFFTEEASDAIDKKAKDLGLWGIARESKITYSGNSLIVRIPKKISEFLGLKRGMPVFLHPEGKKRLAIEAI